MKQWLILLSLGLLVVLSGCRSQNEAKIFNALNEHISSQNKCNVNNQTLTDLISKETTIYNDIIEKGLDPFDQVQPLIEEGKTTVQESRTYLETYQACILRARLNQSELEKQNQENKNDQSKTETNTLISQYVNYETSLMKYVEALLALNEAQNVFYREITPSTPVARLDELVTAINLAIDEANAISLLHQEALVTFNTSYTNYYETYIK
ncbi:YkyA family protein [Turicibacter bilis]|uniref:YkyA family protein n=1 Tax=Turicibacter bilis TaxID=2735723 RepID=A0A9Q9FHN6_9FIRM|nr:YkyA family protein [Turicibacter bilis]MBS3197716.1 YkyA family protein [Turicibacter bilis]UUF07394.1 YkyA family protein [Turicibacter bilis]